MSGSKDPHIFWMNFQDRQRILDRITNGYAFITYDGTYYKIQDIRPAQRQFGQIIYQQKYEELIRNRGITEKEAEYRLLEKGLWNISKQGEYDELIEEIKKLKKSLLLYTYQSNKRKEVMGEITQLEKKVRQLLKNKNTLSVHTVEYIAQIEVYKYYVSQLTTTLDEQKLWSNWEVFCKTASDKFVNKIINEVYFAEEINEATIRELARSDPWKSSWIGANKTGNLFDGPSANWTDWQKGLVTWSIIYDNSMESSEAPSEDILSNDMLFDAWLLTQVEKRQSGESTKKPGDELNTQEVGIVVDSYEDALNVYNLNSPGAKKILRQRGKVIQEKGQADLFDFQDVRQDLQMQINSLKRPGHG